MPRSPIIRSYIDSAIFSITLPTKPSHTITSTEPSIATAFSSYVDELDRAYDGGDLGPRNKSAFVIVGMTPGTTDVRITTEGEDVTISVSVVP